jgi:predicted glutamine amidotransferase
MCRMFVFKGDLLFGEQLLNALTKAAKSDRFNNFKSHKDGWGGVVIGNQKEQVTKSKIPIYEDKASKIFDTADNDLYGLFHARLTAPNEPVLWPFHSHPYMIHGDDESLYIAHNGWVDKKVIGEKFNINYKNRNDTEVLALMIDKIQGNIKDRLLYAIDFVNENALLGSLNLLCVINGNDGKREICYYSKSKEESIYIKLFKYKNGNEFSVMSSTVAFEMGYLDENGKIKNEFVETVPQNKLFFY